MKNWFLVSTIMVLSFSNSVISQSISTYGQILSIGGQTIDSVFISYESAGSFDGYHNDCALEFVYPFPTNPNTSVDTFMLTKQDRSTTGLTARDLLLIRNHILGGPIILDNVGLYGDYNQNGSVSTLDLVLLSKVILRTDPVTLDEPWNFYIPQNTFPALYQIGNENEFVVNGDLLDEEGMIDLDLEINAFKIGDVDGSYWSNNVMEVQNLCSPTSKPVYTDIFCDLDSIFLQQGDEFSIPFKFEEDLEIYGMHFSFQSDKVDVLSIDSEFIDLQDGINFNNVDSSFVLISVPTTNITSVDYNRGTTYFTLTLRANQDFFLYDLFTEKPEFPRELYVNTDFEVLQFAFEDLELTSIKDFEENDFKIFPNPVNDQLLIEWSGLENLRNISFDIFDVRGRSVAHFFEEGLITHQKLTFDIPRLSESLYFLRINSNGRSTFKKLLVIQR